MSFKLNIPIGVAQGQGILQVLYFVEDPKNFSKFALDKIELQGLEGDNGIEYFLGIYPVRQKVIFLVPVEYFEWILIDGNVEKLDEKFLIQLLLFPYPNEQKRPGEYESGIILEVSVKILDIVKLLFQVEKMKK